MALETMFGASLDFERPDRRLSVKAARTFEDRQTDTTRLDLVILEQVDGPERAIGLSIGRYELPLVCACALGLIPVQQGPGESEGQVSGYRLRFRPEGLEIELREGPVREAIQLTLGETFWLSEFLLRQLQLNLPHASIADLVSLLRCLIGREAV